MSGSAVFKRSRPGICSMQRRSSCDTPMTAGFPQTLQVMRLATDAG
jgi:hypothetical protein